MDATRLPSLLLLAAALVACTPKGDCSLDSDCATASVCAARACVPRDCPDRTCAEGEACLAQACAATSCADVACAAGETCAAGRCYPKDCDDTGCGSRGVCLTDSAQGQSCVDQACVGIVCTGSNRCARGTCYPPDCPASACGGSEVCAGEACVLATCAGVVCAAGDRCADGRCLPAACAGKACAADEVCETGACVAAACAGVVCPAGSACQDGRCGAQGQTALFFNVTLPDDTVEYRRAMPEPGGSQQSVASAASKGAPMISPDLRWLLYVVGGDATTNGQLWMRELATGVETDLQLAARAPLDWHPSGARFLYQDFVVCAEYVLEAQVSFPAAGPTVDGTQVVVPFVSGRPTIDAAYSPDGEQVAFSVNLSVNCAGGYQNESIAIAPMSALPIADSAMVVLADESHFNGRAAWSTDGKTVYWWQGNENLLLRRPVDASEPAVQLGSMQGWGAIAAPPAGYLGPYVLAVADSDGAGGSEIFLLEADGTRHALGVGANKGVGWPMSWRLTP